MHLKVKLDVAQYDRPYLSVDSRPLIHPYSDRADCTAVMTCMRLEEVLAAAVAIPVDDVTSKGVHAPPPWCSRLPAGGRTAHASSWLGDASRCTGKLPAPSVLALLR